MTGDVSLAKGRLFREWPLLLALSLIVVTRLLWLDADANFFKRAGDIGDEANWWNLARNKVVFGEWVLAGTPGTFGWWATPLHIVVEVASFRLAGVNFYGGRLPSALSGIFLLVLMYAAMRRDYDGWTGLVTLALLGLNVHFYNYNRLGLVEPFRLLLLFASVWVWFRLAHRPILGACLSAVLAAGALLAKIQPDIVLCWLSLWLIEGWRGTLRWKRVAAFVGVLGSGALVSLPLIAGHWKFVLDRAGILAALVARSYGTLADAPFRPYAVLTNDVLTLVPVFLLFLPALPALVEDFAGFMSSPRRFLHGLKAVNAACLAILVGTLAAGILYDYGDRRMFPLLVPLAVYAARGVSQRWRIPSLASKLVWDKKRVLFGMFALAALWVSWWKDVSTNPWPDLSLYWWLAWAALGGGVGLALLGVYFSYRRVWRQDARSILAALAATYLFVLSQQTAANFAENIMKTRLPLSISVLLAAALAMVGLLAYRTANGGSGRIVWGWSVLAAYFLLGSGVMGAQMLRPSFSVRDASRRIGEVVRHGETAFVDMSYDICVESEAKCFQASANSPVQLRRLMSEPTLNSGRRFWLTTRSSRSVYGPPASPCLYDREGVPLAALTRIEEFRIRRGPIATSIVLYELHTPSQNGCPPREGG